MQVQDRENIVSSWLKETVYQESVDKVAAIQTEEVKNVVKEVKGRIFDPKAIGEPEEAKRPIKITLQVDAEKIGEKGESYYNVNVMWEESGKPIFTKSFVGEGEAQTYFYGLEKVLGQIDSIIDKNIEEAETLSKTFLNDLSSGTEKVVEEVPSLTHTMTSKLLKSYRDGVELHKAGGEIGIKFSDDFIVRDLLGGRIVSSESTVVDEPTEVFSTFGKNHIGFDDYTVSYYKKARLSNGNIVRDIIKLERNDNTFYCLAEVQSRDNFIKIAEKLVPLSNEYDLHYDSQKKAWYTTNIVKEASLEKEAGATIMWFDTVDEAIQYTKDTASVTPKEVKPEETPHEEMKFDKDILEKLPDIKPAEEKKEEIKPVEEPVELPKMSSLNKKDDEKLSYIGIKKTENEPWSIVYSKTNFKDTIRKEAEFKKLGYLTNVTENLYELLNDPICLRDFSEQTTTSAN